MNPAPSLFQTARALVVRDVQLLWRRRGDALQPALFALLVVVLFALGLGTSPQALSKVAPAVLWVAVLLAGLLSLDTLFRGDAEDGSLEQWILAPVPLAWLVLVRVLTHWATTALPRNRVSSDNKPASSTATHSTAAATFASACGSPPSPSANSTTTSRANNAGCAASPRRRHNKRRSRRIKAAAAPNRPGAVDMGAFMPRLPDAACGSAPVAPHRRRGW